jgi:hypothetical protein
MNEAAQILFKHTDFQCFSKVNTDVTIFWLYYLWPIETRKR